MKITNKQYVIIIVTLTIALLIYVATATIINHKAELTKKDIEIQEALKPSKIEVQKEELISLESDWKKKQMTIEAFEEKLQELRNEKLAIEPKIREKRNELLWIVK